MSYGSIAGDWLLPVVTRMSPKVCVFLWILRAGIGRNIGRRASNRRVALSGITELRRSATASNRQS
jgi:hypothetical protein